MRFEPPMDFLANDSRIDESIDFIFFDASTKKPKVKDDPAFLRKLFSSSERSEKKSSFPRFTPIGG